MRRLNRHRQIGRIKLLGGAAVAGILVTSAAGFTAANTVDATKAGQGASTISGYSATSVHYTLNATDATKIDAVAFTLDSAPVSGSTVKVSLVTPASWYACTFTGAAVTCNTTSPQATVAPSNSLNVAVAD